MGLMTNATGGTGATSTIPASNNAPSTAASKAPRTPLSKDDRAVKYAAFKVKRAEKLATQKKATDELIKAITDAGLLDKLSPASKDFIKSLTEVKTRSAGTQQKQISVFTKVFGENAKVGDSVTLNEVFQAVFEGDRQFESRFKKWETKGIVVEATPATPKINTKYTIKALPAV